MNDDNIQNDEFNLINSEKIEFKISKLESFEKLVYDVTTFYINFLGNANTSDIKDQIYKLGVQIKDEVNKGIQAILEILFFIELNNKFVSHSIKVIIFAVFIAKSLKLSEQNIDDIIVAALLHDIGRLKLPKKFANSSIASNYKSDQERFNKHPAVGYTLLREDLHYPDHIAKMVLNHHEQLDSKGFPNQIGKSEISDNDSILYTANFVANVLKATEYSGLKKMIATLENTFSLYPDKFNAEIFIKLISLLKQRSRIDRKHNRYIINNRAFYKYKLSDKEIDKEAILENLSEGGVKINTTEKIHAGTIIYLSIVFEDPPILDIKCVVMRNEIINEKLFAVGLKFIQLNKEQHEAIVRYLEARKKSTSSENNIS